MDENSVADISNDQKRFTVFGSIEEALSYIDNIQKQRDDIEFVIYDKDENALVNR